MKTYLKRLTAIVFILFAVSLSAMAQESHFDKKAFIQKVSFKMFDMDLHKNDVPGIVTSTLYTLVQCKDRYPDMDYSRLLNTVSKVERESSDPSIAYKAYLVNMYFSHSGDIQVTPFRYAYDHDQLFKQIADQLEAKFLAYNRGETTVANK
ncbi:MAG: hypothetical protein ACLP05_04600 [Candidatus Kryptoniota bacterium]